MKDVLTIFLDFGGNLDLDLDPRIFKVSLFIIAIPIDGHE